MADKFNPKGERYDAQGQSVKRVIKKVKSDKSDTTRPGAWWKSKTQKELADTLLATAAFLKRTQRERLSVANMHSQLYQGLNIPGVMGASFNGNPSVATNGRVPLRRGMRNVVQSVIDTKVNRISQSRPRPRFLTNDGSSKDRLLAKQINLFINGEFHQTNAYKMGQLALRDSGVLGTGIVKVVRIDNRVALERRVLTDLFVDPDESVYGNPRQLYEVKIIDRAVLQAYYPDAKSEIKNAVQATVVQSNSETVSDMVIVVEGWRLPSCKDADDGRHTIACSDGVVFDEPWTRSKFPFVFLHDSPRIFGFWAQGAAERGQGAQWQINQWLQVMARSVELCGVPRVFMDPAAKMPKTYMDNKIGVVIPVKPGDVQFQAGTMGLGGDIFEYVDRLARDFFVSEGISEMTSGGAVPMGVTSGAAIRSYDNLATDRMAVLSSDYQRFFQDLAYLMIEEAMAIADETGGYETVFPDKNGTHKVDLPKFESMDPFVIQCFSESSLPQDPAGRNATVVEWMSAGIVTPQEGRRLLDFPDLEQVNKLAFALEERILSDLDDIVEKGKYSPPDPYLLANPPLFNKRCVEYYNRWVVTDLAESRLKMLRDYQTAGNLLVQQAAGTLPGASSGAPPNGGPPGPNGAPPGAPGPDEGVPGAQQGRAALPPVSPMIPNVA